MTIECPNISNEARLSLAQTARVLGVDTRTAKKYAGMLGIVRHQRAIGGFFYFGKDVKKIWMRIA